MPKAVQAPEREEVAIHEAGHVAMLLLLLPTQANIVFATIVRGHTAAGEINRIPVPRLRPNDAAQILMAGMAAQVLGCEKRNPWIDRKQAFNEYSDRCWTDLTSLEEKHNIHGDQALVFMEQCMAKLAPHWVGLKAVAGELLEHGTLYHQEAGMVFAGKSQSLAWYRKNRRPAPPPPEWGNRGVPGSLPGPWFAPLGITDTLRFVRDSVLKR